MRMFARLCRLASDGTFIFIIFYVKQCTSMLCCVVLSRLRLEWIFKKKLRVKRIMYKRLLHHLCLET